MSAVPSPKKPKGNATAKGNGSIELPRQVDYAPYYQVSEKTIKNWLARGRELGQPCPLSRPADLIAWWPLAYGKTRMPPGIMQAAAMMEAAAPAPPMPTMASAPPDTPPASEQTRLETELGLAAARDRSQVMELSFYQAYQKAALELNPVKMTLFGKAWGDFAAQLRAIEKTATDVLRERGELVPRAVVERVLAGSLAQQLKQMRSFNSKWEQSQKIKPDEARETAWQKLLDEMLPALAGLKFTEG